MNCRVNESAMKKRRDFLGGWDEVKLSLDALNCNKTARFDEIGCNNILRIPVIKLEFVLICSKGSSLFRKSTQHSHKTGNNSRFIKSEVTFFKLNNLSYVHTRLPQITSRASSRLTNRTHRIDW
jgi:hypothetical protein